jgi:hypothetical protein
MAKGEIPKLMDFFMGTTVNEEELQAYHSHGWLTGNVISSSSEVDVPIVYGSTVLYFKSHLLDGLGLPSSKFLAAIMNYLGCSLVHFNANAIAALSSFVMLCECWLEIPPDSSLFWYYYSPSRYAKFICDGIGLYLRRHHQDEYIPALFNGCWKNSQKKWFLVDMHVQPSWENKLLFPPLINAQWREPLMNVRLSALVKRVAELPEARLKACHCIEEFHLQRIRPLGRQDKCTYECPWMVDPNRKPAKGKLSILYFKYWCYNYSTLTFLPSCIALSQEEVDWLMG